jgi:hypothetical protein
LTYACFGWRACARSSDRVNAMYSQIPNEAVTSAFQLVSYVFAAFVALLSWAITFRS